MADDARIAVDVGGTFTDVVKLVPDTGELTFEKVATTPDAPTRGVLGSFTKAGAQPGQVTMFNHGTTLGLNALLTRTGARTAVVTTAGFRDVYLLGRTDRRVMYDITYRKPPALLNREDTFEVGERCYFDGSVAVPFDESDARSVARRIAERGYQAVAVAFLHSYANPEHERRMAAILDEEAPGVEVTLSHQLSREYREYERTSTAVLDAYIKPTMRRYLTELHGQLEADGFDGTFLMSRSGGGAMTVEAAREQPVNLILSGPAGGVIGAAGLARLVDRPNLITIDMGGTSLDASLVMDGEPVMYQGTEFEGLPINTPSLYIHTIGAGGGSIAWLDEAGALQVGPQSAGAIPGPAAYGAGGTRPTFTDAAVVLGYLGADVPLGGDLTVDASLAEKALADTAVTLGLSITELARGILQISTTKIMGAVRAITVELGRDPKDFALLTFGGGGGLVAVDVARELGIPTVVVPPGQGAFSALGMLMADVQHDLARTSVIPLSEASASFFDESFAAMEAEAHEMLAGEGFGPERRVMSRTVDVRYAGQEHSVTVPYPDGSTAGVAGSYAGDAAEAAGSDAADAHGAAEHAADGPLSLLERRFTVMHERMYGHTMQDPIEITTLRVRAVGVVDKPALPRLPGRDGGDPAALGERAVYAFDDAGRSYRLYRREDLRSGDVLAGPAIVAEHTATTVLHAGDRLQVGEHAELIIDVAPNGKAGPHE
ncbi:hydantoinase/oxoprolinase family protein [Actinobacteria bacterium YIM 96077]|uniref:Hydantoinase/oxoprolinase family protein n=1 Tax=Phytoactinopolyspora halophila TaxID=1981511 RepID=A0A329QEQ3_9ACTN|nr:hydantoinase/oxoprolinase family protein [Phytoactinopolyspora halophila]AYY15518.1 hydantoinase/oxoprolinase family protein [Actinobacteria bacterium YIM 96077]RAW10764.1 hydantoinase/oxoprolinase family protein [Phytoactinopolyspora halophila]